MIAVCVMVIVERQINLLRKAKASWLIPLADEKQSVQVKICYPFTTRAIPEHLTDASCGGAIQIDYLYLFLFLHKHAHN